jgi:hypothetical protein
MILQEISGGPPPPPPPPPQQGVGGARGGGGGAPRKNMPDVKLVTSLLQKLRMSEFNCTSRMVYGVDRQKFSFVCLQWCTRWRSWLRHCVTSRKVAGSIPCGVVGIFH